MSDTNTGDGNVVVNRAMSLDGFIAAPASPAPGVTYLSGDIGEAVASP